MKNSGISRSPFIVSSHSYITPHNFLFYRFLTYMIHYNTSQLSYIITSQFLVHHVHIPPAGRSGLVVAVVSWAQSSQRKGPTFVKTLGAAPRLSTFYSYLFSNLKAHFKAHFLVGFFLTSGGRYCCTYRGIREDSRTKDTHYSSISYLH